MMELPRSLFVYRDAWNTLDSQEIRPLLEESLDPNCLFVDPAHVCNGIGEIESMIREFRTGFPTSTYELASGIDGHNRRYRYRWTARLDDLHHGRRDGRHDGYGQRSDRADRRILRRLRAMS